MFQVYLIQNKINGAIYIGKAKDTEARWKKHLSVAYGKRTKEKRYLHRAIFKYGSENFSFSVIEEHGNEEDCNEAEIFFIEYFLFLGARLYNLTKGGEGVSGRVVTKETREKISKSRIGLKHTDETKEKLRIINTGKKLSPERIEKTASKLRGRKQPEELKMRWRKPKSEEGRRNMSAAQKEKWQDVEFKASMKGKFKRKTIPAGQNNPSAKLTEEQVIEIRRLYNEDHISSYKIWKMYNHLNISYTTIKQIIKRETWKHI